MGKVEITESDVEFMKSIAGPLARDDDLAREAVQEAAVAISRGQYEERGQHRAWVRRVVKNKTIDGQRQRSRRSMFERHQSRGDDDDDWIESIPDTRGLDPSDLIAERELGQQIRAAIDELTPPHKAVILLRAVEGLSYEEISQVLQCSRGTVMSRLHYARKALRISLNTE